MKKVILFLSVIAMFPIQGFSDTKIQELSTAECLALRMMYESEHAKLNIGFAELSSPRMRTVSTGRPREKNETDAAYNQYLAKQKAIADEYNQKQEEEEKREQLQRKEEREKYSAPIRKKSKAILKVYNNNNCEDRFTTIETLVNAELEE